MLTSRWANAVYALAGVAAQNLCPELREQAGFGAVDDDLVDASDHPPRLAGDDVATIADHLRPLTTPP